LGAGALVVLVGSEVWLSLAPLVDVEVEVVLVEVVPESVVVGLVLPSVAVHGGTDEVAPVALPSGLPSPPHAAMPSAHRKTGRVLKAMS
jgi:hypothetical protein